MKKLLTVIALAVASVGNGVTASEESDYKLVLENDQGVIVMAKRFHRTYYGVLSHNGNQTFVDIPLTKKNCPLYLSEFYVDLIQKGKYFPGGRIVCVPKSEFGT